MPGRNGAWQYLSEKLGTMNLSKKSYPQLLIGFL